MDDNDHLLDSKEDIQSHILDFYESLLGGNQIESSASLNDILALLPQRLSSSVIESISQPFTDEDIQKVFFSMPKNKAPGPDGFPSEFFTGNWDVVGRDVLDAVHEFFSSGSLLQQWNAHSDSKEAERKPDR